MAPETTCIGIDGYRNGWVGARLQGATITWVTCPVPSIGSMLTDGATIGIDMPIGLARRGWRECDRLAKAELGAAGARVFMTPPREVLELGLTAPNDAVQQLSRRLTGQGTSRQALGLAERILALDTALPDARATVVEVHPELSFAELSGQPLASKKSARGVGQRCEALEHRWPQVSRTLATAPADVPVDDALDALIALWSVERWRDGVARTLPPGASDAPFIAI